MSRTDKTRPYRVKLAEAQSADPYGTTREAWLVWRPEFRCCCKSCTDPTQTPRAKRRRETRLWQREAERGA
jgi:hypothetical protein